LNGSVPSLLRRVREDQQVLKHALVKSDVPQYGTFEGTSRFVNAAAVNQAALASPRLNFDQPDLTFQDLHLSQSSGNFQPLLILI
jgi:hypothetical protein